MATDAKVKVKVELDSELQAAREALKKWKAKREKPRVCRGCKWLRGQRCQALGLFGENVLYVDTEQDGKHHPLIHRPDDFGCNKWEAKP